jgi:glycosyltransferase involved in cell wall biosynthesis
MIIVNSSDLMPPDWRFLEPACDDPDIRWTHVSGRPANLLERVVRRPYLARWRAAAQVCAAARAAPQESVILTHLPGLTMATGLMRRRLCPAVPQVAFSFNFTTLPGGLRHRLMVDAFAGIAEFVVYSRYERGLYAERFGLDPARLRFLPWAMSPPVAGPELPPGLPEGPYLCAIGGEGRDYRSLAEAMRRLPALRMVVVGRSYSVAGIDFPDNVTVHVDLPAPQTWALAQRSQGMAIPLRSEDTACGHVTLVGAQLLGIPLVLTRSVGVADYVEDGATARLVAAGDAAGLAAALQALVEDPEGSAAMAARARAEAEGRSDPRRWVDYLRELQDRHAAGTLLPA